MVQSQNTQVELTEPASMLTGIPTTGSLMLGDAALEYYNGKNPGDFVQIPWTEIDAVAASVLFGGRMIPRFCVITRSSGRVVFSTRHNHQVLRAIRDHIGEDRMRRSPTFFKTIVRGIGSLFRHGKRT